jgi:hypothetical protein
MILVFSGREHHTGKLRPIFEGLKSAGKNVAWVFGNNAINIDSPLTYTLPSGDPFIHMYTRMRPGDDDAVDGLVGQLRDELPFIEAVSPFWQTFSFREAAEVYVAFHRVLEQEEVEALLVLHTNNFWAKMLAYICQEKDIPVFAFQEGLLRDRDQATMNKQALAAEYCDTLFVWGQKSKTAYVKAGVKSSQLHISGPPHLDKYSGIKKTTVAEALGGRVAIVFAPTTSDEYLGNILEDAQKIQKDAIAAGAHFLFHPHPFERERLATAIDTLSTIRPIDPLILAASRLAIFVGQHSTIMIEGLALGALIVEYQKEGKPILQPLAKRRAAIDANMETLPGIFNGVISGEYIFDDQSMRKVAKEEMSNHFGSATKEVVKTILKRVK